MIGDMFFVRRFWAADVRRVGDAIWLDVRRGSRHVTIWRNSLETFQDSRHPAERIAAKIGDAFVVCGPSIDETIAAVVEQVDGERLRVALRGELAAETRVVQMLVMDGLKAKPKTKKGKTV